MKTPMKLSFAEDARLSQHREPIFKFYYSVFIFSIATISLIKSVNISKKTMSEI